MPRMGGEGVSIRLQGTAASEVGDGTLSIVLAASVLSPCLTFRP